LYVLAWYRTMMARRVSRRRYLVGTGAALTTGLLAGCSGGSGGESEESSSEESSSDGGSDEGSSDGGSGAESSSDGSSVEMLDDVPTEIDDYLSEGEAKLYEGTIADYTGQDEVVVDVGAGDIGFAFAPPAIRVDAGTTVVWEWTGEGGAHNVVSEDAAATQFNSGDPIDEQGYTFEQTFESAGIQLYYCTPHKANGKIGGVEVVE
jgi:serine/threonine-protein kinase